MVAARRQRRFPPHGRCASPLRLPKRVDHLNARSGAQVTFESMPASLVAWYRWRMTVTIGRRELLAALGGAVAAWPLAARARQRERMRRIGVLMTRAADDPQSRLQAAAFQLRLQELGWTNDANIRIGYRWGSGDVSKYRKYAAELVALASDVIVA